MRRIDWDHINYDKAYKAYKADKYNKLLAETIGKEMWYDFNNQQPSIHREPDTDQEIELTEGLSLRLSLYFDNLLNSCDRLKSLDLDNAAVLYIAASDIAFSLQQEECQIEPKK